MSRNTRKTIEKMLKDPRAQEYMKTASKAKSSEEAVQVYEKLAKELGLDLTAEEIREYIQQTEQACRERTDHQAAQIRELTEEELSMASGGAVGSKKNPECMESYQDYENCWYADGCDNIFQIYDQYICHRGFFTDHCHETAVPCDHDYYYQN